MEHSCDESDIVSTNVSKNIDESWIDDFISELNKGTSKNMEHSCDESDIVSTNVSEIIEVSREDDLISESEKTLKYKVEYWNVDIISEMESMNFQKINMNLVLRILFQN